MSWTVNREIVVVAGWGRALLLQVAHPLIASAVAEHSSFRGSLRAGTRRLASTIGAMLDLTFGTDDEAIDAAAGINVIHDRVVGHLALPAPPHAAGAAYAAHDPELLRWVHVTLLESIPLAYELLVAPLSPADRDRYCAESSVMEPLLGIPPGLLPRDAASLDAFMTDTWASRRVMPSAVSRELAQAILFPPGWRLVWPAFRPVHLITIGLLPPALRDAYGFRWSSRDERALRRWVRALRALRRATPSFLREWPKARRATQRRRSGSPSVRS